MSEKFGRDQLKRAIDAGEVTVVETLGSEHFEQGHLPGAIHIHFEDITEKAPELLPDRDATIVTYCSNVACSNSELAAAHLGNLGYGSVRRYVEGKEDWQEAGYALETGA